MRAMAKWLVARPLNGVLVLAATSSPYLGFLSAALIVLLVLHDGARVAILKAGAAGLLLAVIGIVVARRRRWCSRSPWSTGCRRR